MFSKKDFKEDIEVLSPILYISTIWHLIVFLITYVLLDKEISDPMIMQLLLIFMYLILLQRLGAALPWLFVGFTALALASASVRFQEWREKPKVFYIRCGCVVCNILFLCCVNSSALQFLIV
ncbi:hypothetical protein [Chakrabartyella piscis]|uniref:hypothetical protein n=1 Tax=Chakrabartyella piscis TaxID=2918914 RepID=UPI002958B0AA|nr:hypothetical protein [Chakrabartyella piscis]